MDTVKGFFSTLGSNALCDDRSCLGEGLCYWQVSWRAGWTNISLPVTCGVVTLRTWRSAPGCRLRSLRHTPDRRLVNGSMLACQ
eukprot:644760-Hanusia_phi.AAC.3